MRGMTRIALGAVLLGFVLMPAVVAHVGTERYIPIGQSPGISGKYSYIGTIESADMAAHSMVLRTDNGKHPVKMSDTTRIYLDRSAQKRTNQRGSYEDCQPGRRVEVKFRDNDPTQPAEWIKVDDSR